MSYEFVSPLDWTDDLDDHTQLMMTWAAKMLAERHPDEFLACHYAACSIHNMMAHPDKRHQLIDDFLPCAMADIYGGKAGLSWA